MRTTHATKCGTLVPALRTWRVRRDLSQAALARKAHVAHTTIVALEHPRRGAHTETIGKLARALGITCRQLTEGHL